MTNNVIKSIYYMLSYAYQTLRQTGLDNVAAEPFDNIHDLFAAILARGVGTQVKRGLHRDYTLRHESLAGLRGKVQVSEVIKQQTLPQGKLVCAYDEYGPDSPHNRALKSTMLLLLRRGDVKPENKQALRRLLMYFGDVSDVAPLSIRWDRLKYHRNNAEYRMLLEICRFVVEGLLLTTERGTYKLATWLPDEQMHRLFERFVLAYYRRHHPYFRPRAATVEWDVAETADSRLLPIMKTDITLEHADRRLIIDTKYYRSTMQYNSLYDSRTFLSRDLYQIYAYVKNSDKAGTGNVAGVLLYAKTDETVTPDHEYVIGGNLIRLKTIDLNQEWSEIIRQLEQLCLWLTVPDSA